ncbi:MAG: HRDC domain-containing protein [Bacteroidales bacterium]|nr:HRDC domain-containing protein [Bacteroidales bacterium]
MTNPQLELARRYVCNTGVSLFLTGKAGTGKTTFLHDIDATVGKRHAVLAPTGVAAVNAGGVTIHSFFQLPFCPYLPDVPELVTEYQLPENKHKLRKSKLDIIRTLELLIIDEISMVRADLLDAVDYTLRRYRHSQRPFGGVQLLMIGDIHQLPPVVKDSEKPYMDRVYDSPFFFNSKALRQLNYITIELQTVYRQQDDRFVALLNRVRDNRVDTETLCLLNARAVPLGPTDREPIRLTTHNYQADSINAARLAALEGKERTFEATIEGTFPESSAPTATSLTLKPQARVMFVKNDSSGSHRYYNGKLATVTAFVADANGHDAIEVRDDDGETIVVARETWENTQYDLDPTDNQIKQHVVGRFVQFPLRTAWAVTIHKAQGLTFDRVVVDASEAFAYGQVYVALSRCRSLEGLTLSSPLGANCVFGNAEVDRFAQTQPSEAAVRDALAANERQYFVDTLFELFGFETLQRDMSSLQSLFDGRLRSLYSDKAIILAQQILAVDQLQEVALRFHRQLLAIEPAAVDDRVAKAGAYFGAQLAETERAIAPLLKLEIDNKEVARAYNDHATRVAEGLRQKLRCLEVAARGSFTVQAYQQAKADSLLSHQPQPKPQPTEPDKALVGLLAKWRAAKAKELEVPPFHVLHQKTLLAVAAALPRSMDELLAVDGIGQKKSAAYGKELLDIVADYCEAYGLPRWQRQHVGIEK